jgi:hypothetical protein
MQHVKQMQRLSARYKQHLLSMSMEEAVAVATALTEAAQAQSMFDLLATLWSPDVECKEIVLKLKVGSLCCW